MTKSSHDINRVKKVVVFFDICSSTKILEDLSVSESHSAWRNLLISLKIFLNAQAKEYPVEVHKFLGDGWVLLFDQEEMTGVRLLEFCRQLAAKYEREFTRRVCPRLQSKDCSTGLTFGVDRGTLVRIRMNRQSEYVGRPLNVAARLQGAIKEKDKDPAGKMLITNAAFADLRLNRLKKLRATEVTRVLRNLSFGESFEARKIVIAESVLLKPSRSKKK